MSAAWETQKAIFDVLTAALEVTVYDSAPDNTPPPYVNIGESTELEWDTDNTLGREMTLTVHSWSAYRGMMDVKELMDVIKLNLHNQNLAVPGEIVVLMLQEFAEVSLDSDGLTRHGVQRFRLLTQGS